MQEKPLFDKKPFKLRLLAIVREGRPQRNHMEEVCSSPFHLQITSSIRERPLRATWAKNAAHTLPGAAVTETGFKLVSHIVYIM